MLGIIRKFSPIAIVLATLVSHCALYLGAIEAGPSENLNSICKSKLDLKSVKEYLDFVDELTRYADKGAQGTTEPKGQSHLKKCLEERESIIALGELIKVHDKRRPCKLSEITRLEEYARKHLFNNKRALTLKFFSLFGVSLGIYCKVNLLAHLKQADSEAEQVDFIYSMASPTGWNTLINEYTKKSMKFGTSGHQDSNVVNRIAKLVPGLSQVEHLDFMDFDHFMDDQQAKAAGLEQGVEFGSFDLKDAEHRVQVLESLEKISRACQNLDKFYVNSVLSLAKLKELGLLVDILNDLHDHSALLHKWLAMTSFCQLIARVRIVSKPDDQATADDASPLSTIKLKILHDDRLLEGRRALYSYAAPFEEIHPMAGELVWQAGVNEGFWRQKNEVMWLPGDRGRQSVAMQRLAQFVKGVEHDFQEGLEEKR